MIIANGTIETANKTPGGIGSDGYATDSLITWDAPIPCQFYANQHNNLGKSNGEHFTNAAYTILLEQQDVASEQLRLKDDKGNEIGVFSIISIEQLDAVCETKILV